MRIGAGERKPAGCCLLAWPVGWRRGGAGWRDAGAGEQQQQQPCVAA